MEKMTDKEYEEFYKKFDTKYQEQRVSKFEAALTVFAFSVAMTFLMVGFFL